MAAGAEADHYGVLGIPRSATVDDVKRAYRALSKVYHPDKAGHLDDTGRRERERQMVALNVAYQVLSSPRERLRYDLSQGSPDTGARAPAGQQGTSNERPGGHGRAASAAAPSGMPSPADSRPGPSEASPPAAPTAAPPPRPVPTGPPKPRYQLGAKYSQRARQARREDPAQYTTHVVGQPGDASSAQSPPASFAGGLFGAGAPAVPPMQPPPGAVRNPTYLQRQMDIAHEWERTHCPETPAEEPYQWKKATSDVWRSLRERRQQREQPDVSQTVMVA